MTHDPTLATAERVRALLDSHGTPAAVIGAHAMAAHRAVRATADLDLAVCVRLDQLRVLAADLRAAGLGVDLREPDPQDPLGGVVDVDGGPGADLVQVVNYFNSTRADSDAGRVLGEAALASARPLVPGLALPVVDLPHLVALKLYAWDGRTATANGGPRRVRAPRRQPAAEPRRPPRRVPARAPWPRGRGAPPPARAAVASPTLPTLQARAFRRTAGLASPDASDASAGACARSTRAASTSGAGSRCVAASARS